MFLLSSPGIDNVFFFNYISNFSFIFVYFFFNYSLSPVFLKVGGGAGGLAWVIG